MNFDQLLSELTYELTLNIASKKQTLLDNRNYIMASMLFAGITAGLLGTGGGMVVTPFLLELGFELNQAQNTSNLLLIFTCSLNFIFYLLSVYKL